MWSTHTNLGDTTAICKPGGRTLRATSRGCSTEAHMARARTWLLGTPLAGLLGVSGDSDMVGKHQQLLIRLQKRHLRHKICAGEFARG